MSGGRQIVLLDLPVPVDARVYDEVRDEATSALLSDAGVVSVYSMGSVGTPGISDLDLIVIVEDETRSVGFARSALSIPVAPYVMMHAPFVVPTSLFISLRSFGTVEDITCLGGRDLGDPDPGSPDTKPATALAAALFAMVSLATQQRLGAFKVRSVLCQAHTLRHTVRVLGLCDAQAPQAAAASRILGPTSGTAT